MHAPSFSIFSVVSGFDKPHKLVRAGQALPLKSTNLQSLFGHLLWKAKVLCPGAAYG